MCVEGGECDLLLKREIFFRERRNCLSHTGKINNVHPHTHSFIATPVSRLLGAA